MRRRDFLTLLGGGAAWPLAALAQQHPPVVAYVYPGRRDQQERGESAFRQGLKETGFSEGQNLGRPISLRGKSARALAAARRRSGRIERRCNCLDRRPQMARIAKEATSTIPVIFEVGTDPSQTGLGREITRRATPAAEAALMTLCRHSSNSRVASVAPTTLVRATAWNHPQQVSRRYDIRRPGPTRANARVGLRAAISA
jgi:putative tryptophan/tyrosine transport system substrate-binding protein